MAPHVDCFVVHLQEAKEVVTPGQARRPVPRQNVRLPEQRRDRSVWHGGGEGGEKMCEEGWEKNQGIEGEGSGAGESDTRHSGSGEVEEKERERGGKIGEEEG